VLINQEKDEKERARGGGWGGGNPSLLLSGISHGKMNTHTHTHQLLLKTFLRVSRNPKAPRKRPSNQTYKIKMDMNGRDRNSWK
jgi:hypothetical protein